MSDDTTTTLRLRTQRLFEYLQAVRALREQPIRDIAKYQDRRWWEGELPQHPACRITIDGQDPWLVVSKVEVPPAPPPDDGIAQFVGSSVSDPSEEPGLIDNLSDLLAHDLDRYIMVVDSFKHYLERRWRPWAADAMRALATRKLYQDLYDLRLRLQREEAYIELVWGHGILSWEVAGERVVHPMVTTRVQVFFDTDTGDIRLTPEAMASHLEIDVLQGLGVGGFDLLVDIRDRFRTAPVSPFDSENRNLYQQLLHPLGLDGSVSEGPLPPAPTSAPTITNTWALFVRRRSTLYQRFFAGLRDALADETFAVPGPLGAIVANEPSLLTGSDAGGDWATVGERLMMPLPTNPEQEQVARRLAEHRGVTVQGPPGTGKTHTIANLISHLVAHGKRVLVTSQKEQALTVLRDKLPEAIRPLSVSVLGSSSSSLAELDQSVQAIYEQAVSLDRRAAHREVDALAMELDGGQREVARLRDRIRLTVEREREQYQVDGTGHTPSTLAQWLAQEADRLGYIPDELSPAIECPLTHEETETLYRLAASLPTQDCVAARFDLPSPGSLPAGQTLAGFAAEFSEIQDRLAGAEKVVPDARAIDDLGPAGLTDLIAAVESASEGLAALEVPWLASIRGEVTRNAAFAATWRDHLKAWQEGIEAVATWGGALAGHRVRLPDDGLPTKELERMLGELRDRVASGKGVSKVFAKELHQLRSRCRVDEEQPQTAADIELCLTEARLRRRRYELVNRWNAEIIRVGGPKIDDTSEHPEYELDSALASLVDAVAWENDGWPRLQDLLVAVNVRTPARPSSADLDALGATLRVVALRFRRRDLIVHLDGLRSHLRTGMGLAEASPLWRALEEALRQRRWRTWDEHRTEAMRLQRLKPEVARLDGLHRRLAVAAPRWATLIVESRGNETGAGPVRFVSEAWRWRQAETWLSDVIRGGDPATLQRQLEQKLRVVATLTAELASASAWLAVAEKLTDAQRQGLTAWAQALKKVGKGTGKYAAKWRAVALQAMGAAQGAVPVWIMPTHRVVESFDPARTMFDVVIVDESSQCDIFSLAALGIARKAVVVGDDKQISPQAVGTDQDTVNELIAQHIADLPHNQLLDITSSLYDIAKRTFPGVIMLKEHFRCLPEIIEFSNQLAYNGEILPLREDSSDPGWSPVVDVHVTDGYREPGTDTNAPEADAIVDKIVRLCADPRYDGKTFGVISMLGDGQAAIIEHRLIDALGEQEVELRRIRCGNAYHFQGDERDIVFISMVVAAGEGRRIGAMTKEADRQRMNVAASRARDQVWCVHSVTADELHSDDVRARFIRFCQNPGRTDAVYADLADRCDSDFERDVLRQLLSRGYNVKVQHKVGRYRIDMVVESRHSRLAVECDGDAFHGPDRWDADRNRQAVLERLGWSFYRIRGSAYYRSPDEALSSLWDRLDVAGIRPVEDGPAASGAPTSGLTNESDQHDQGAPDAAQPLESPLDSDGSVPESIDVAAPAASRNVVLTSENHNLSNSVDVEGISA